MNNDFLPRRGKRQDKHLAETTTDAKEQEVAFKPPEDIAAEEDREAQSATPAMSTTQSTDDAPAMPSARKPKRSIKERLKAITKKQWIIIAAVAVLVLGGGGVGAYFAWFHHTPKPVVRKTVATNKVSLPPAPAPLVSTLTGLPISDASINNLPVTAIMVENSIDARPQSGLNDAGVVFEAVAEGGITRFLTLWQDTAPNNVGPVRSVRPYYLQWLLGFDAPVAHVGGSADALSLIKTWNVKNLDQFYNPAPYWRISTRYAPHNMYTDVTKLHTLEAQKGYTTSNYTGFPRKAEQPTKSVTARTIDFTISGTYYNSHYDYDPATNSYLRSEGGQPHMDANTNKQINPKVVIALIMDQGQNGEYTTYNTLGSGKAYVFQDGTVTIGTWTKTSNQSQFVFKDQSGAELKLNAGRTWITVLGGDNRVAYKP